MKTITYKQITEKDLSEYEAFMLPMIYEELLQQSCIEENYIALAAIDEDTALGVVIAELEDGGDINLLSIWTAMDRRREGIASGLLQKMTEVARALYKWDDGQYGDDITLKTMYCLDDRYRKIYEAWLEKNGFTDFMVMRDETEDRPDICGATAEIHFYRW
ncbi:MAG: GNAT family N-acetyltransferase [Butyrivibrio sp.]|nr:GNAT family N-acetyltransferase [Butyrivibrio sp.]